MFISALARMSVAWGKDGKLRITPITSGMVALLRVWLAERAGQPAEPLFVTQSGTSLSRDAVEHRRRWPARSCTNVVDGWRSAPRSTSRLVLQREHSISSHG